MLRPIQELSGVPETVTSDMSALRLVSSPNAPRRLARMLLAVLLLTTLALLFLPWQQAATGTGQVTAYSPLERTQAVPAPISGRIVNWYGHREGSRVKKGEIVVQIEDNDPEYLSRLQQGVEQAQLKVAASKTKVEEYDFHILQLEAYRDFTIEAANSVLEGAKQKIKSAQQGLEAAKAELLAASLNYDRKKPLADEGYESDRAVDIATRELTVAKTNVEKYSADLEAAKAELEAKESTRDSYRSDGDSKISKARAEREDALGEVALAEKELLNARRDLARQSTQEVNSPVDGTILRLQAAATGDQVKAGDPLFLVVPDVFHRAVEIWVDGNDATLIEPGSKVRLVFEGFPGVQFAGWPSVAVGTFGGIVDLVDATDNGQGAFRVLVLPDESEDQWPGDPYLRQGVKVNGWVLLNQVPLWYEVWRKLNGFPPTIADGPPGAKVDKEVKKLKK